MFSYLYIMEESRNGILIVNLLTYTIYSKSSTLMCKLLYQLGFYDCKQQKPTNLRMIMGRKLEAQQIHGWLENMSWRPQVAKTGAEAKK